MKSKEEMYLEIENLIHYLVNCFGNFSNRDDLYQAGCLGFIKAYDNYKIDSNCKFSTYAYKYILGEIKSAIRNDKGMHISREISNINYKIEKAYSLLSQKLMRKPSIEEISNYLEIPSELVIEAINSTNKIQSIDESLTDEGKELTYQDVIGTKKEIDDLIMLKDTLNSLTDEEQKILLGKYLNGYTQTELSEMIGINQVQVSRKERKILTKVKQTMMTN